MGKIKKRMQVPSTSSAGNPRRRRRSRGVRRKRLVIPGPSGGPFVHGKQAKRDENPMRYLDVPELKQPKDMSFVKDLPVVEPGMWSGARTGAELGFGQMDYKLDDVELPKPMAPLMPKEYLVSLLTPEHLFSEFIEPSLKMIGMVETGENESMSKRTKVTLPEPLFENEKFEIVGILKGLMIYCARVKPDNSRKLFGSMYQKDNSRKLGYRSGGWLQVIKLAKEKITFFKDLDDQGTEAHLKFEEKMGEIMRLSEGVELHQWAPCLVGYCIAFWVGTWYNKRGVQDDELPRQLVLAKEHYFEYFGIDYRDPMIIITPDKELQAKPLLNDEDEEEVEEIDLT